MLDHDLNVYIFCVTHVHKHTYKHRKNPYRESTGGRNKRGTGGERERGQRKGRERGKPREKRSVCLSWNHCFPLDMCPSELRGQARRCCENCENKNNSHLEINKRGYSQGPGHSISSSFTQQASLTQTKSVFFLSCRLF